MDKYESLGLVGEGSYGMVIKCRNRENGSFVAIKKFLETEEDRSVKKIAMREIKMLRKLRHENLVNLLEVFRRRKRLYLVFEFVDHTLLDDLEKHPYGLKTSVVQRVLWQVFRAVSFMHSHNVIHRDIKPENILHSRTGLIKLCDFGFARSIAHSGELYTDYVATRWYRAPELLVGDPNYGKAVDVWAIGCLTVEMLSGRPLFPGDSEIDQLYQVINCFGKLSKRHQDMFYRNPVFSGIRLPSSKNKENIKQRFPTFTPESLNLINKCLEIDPNDRPETILFLSNEFFIQNDFMEKVLPQLRRQIQKESLMNRSKSLKVNNRNKQKQTASVKAKHCLSSDAKEKRKIVIPAVSSRSKVVKKQNKIAEFKMKKVNANYSYQSNRDHLKNLSNTINKAAGFINEPSKGYQKSLFPNIAPQQNNKYSTQRRKEDCTYSSKKQGFWSSAMPPLKNQRDSPFNSTSSRQVEVSNMFPDVTNSQYSNSLMKSKKK